jgi:methylthioribose-1-phosphate isomerase
VLTHCNAGALATLGWGTATAPIYLAQLAGIPVHVWVSETRPRLQGAKLTAWEMRANGVPHTLIVDAAGAALMRQHRVDLVLVGADRVAANGDVCNKIGTYEKALAANDNRIPMYAAVPSSTIDWALADGDAIPIEERSADEVIGLEDDAIAPAGTRVLNPAFDVTPGRLLTGIVTERGICSATAGGLAALFAPGTRQ